MNCVKAVRDYVTKMITDTAGMKVMLLDPDTTPIVSMVYAQSEILQKEVYLLESIKQTAREVMTHLKAIVFIRPTQSSIDALVAELKRPKYGQYDIYLTNVLKPSQLERLAEADEHEVVREVQEFFADYLALGPQLFNFNLTGVVGDDPRRWHPEYYDRVQQGLLALLLSLKKKPVIRYQESSPQCKKLAQEVGGMMSREASLFDFRVSTDIPSILLVIDRRDDPITPLLNQWTYQAMVHERLGITNNRVDLSKVPNVGKDMKEIVLSSEQDEFYQRNMMLNFGEIGENIKSLVDEFQQKSKANEKLETIADMKNFVENYPQFRAMSGSVSKHVSVVGELSRQVDVYDLLTLSETEQELVCQGKHTEMVQNIKQILASQKLNDDDRLRLVMLYAVRYENSSNSSLRTFVDTLEQQGVPHAREKIDRLLDYAGARSAGRSSDLFGTRGAAGLLKKVTGGLKGVENIYTQHTPLLAATLDQLAKGKLKDGPFPFVDRQYREKPQDVIVFMVGGCTYAEARTVAQFNDTNPHMRVLLGGTAVHNMKSFLEEVRTSSAGK
eukprot:m.1637974 g.1637974  ORF g.1637974 m.1637974 type:complete len:556 (-) comp26530_c0_seq1:268-1935(-)